MRKLIYLTKAKKIENTLQLISEESVSLNHLKALGQVIVDSEKCSFVYLAEDENDYTYLYIPDVVWKEVHDAIHNHNKIIAVSETEQLELVNVNEELSYLISNIEGNSNYGEHMVLKVEEIFLASTSGL